MNNASVIKKEKLLSFLTVLSTGVLCIQHFWGSFADPTEIQVAYIPLIITLSTIGINESANSYKKRKKIVILSAIGAICLAIVGLSLIAIDEYNIVFDPSEWLNRLVYIFVTIITFLLTIFEIEKAVMYKR